MKIIDSLPSDQVPEGVEPSLWTRIQRYMEHKLPQNAVDLSSLRPGDVMTMEFLPVEQDRLQSLHIETLEKEHHKYGPGPYRGSAWGGQRTWQGQEVSILGTRMSPHRPQMRAGLVEPQGWVEVTVHGSEEGKKRMNEILSIDPSSIEDRKDKEDLENLQKDLKHPESVDLRNYVSAVKYVWPVANVTVEKKSK